MLVEAVLGLSTQPAILSDQGVPDLRLGDSLQRFPKCRNKLPNMLRQPSPPGEETVVRVASVDG